MIIDMTGIKQLSKRRERKYRDAIHVALFLTAVVIGNFVFMWVVK